jgi:hypothetical protein
MKDQYFGDINDYFKYGMLRCFAKAGLSVGVCWMMTPNDGRPDGRKIEYLADKATWRDFDPMLFDSLEKAIKRRRSIRHVHYSRILPNCTFCADIVPEVIPLRKKWLTRSLGKLSGVDVMFFDPDNGIEVTSTQIGKRGSSKFLFWHEIEKAWDEGCSLLVFQHFPRENHAAFVKRRVDELSKRVLRAQVVPLITSNVVYLLAHRQHHKAKVDVAIDLIVKSWKGRIWTQF